MIDDKSSKYQTYKYQNIFHNDKPSRKAACLYYCFLFIVTKLSCILSPIRNLLVKVDLLIMPDSVFKVAWDTVMLLLLIVNIFYIPMKIAFEGGILVQNNTNGNTNTWLHAINLIDKPWQDQYIACVYWAVITLTTVGYGDIVPVNTKERAFLMSMTLISCGVFAYSINSIGNIISSMTQNQQQFQKQMATLTTYLRKRQIDKDLQLRIKNYFEYLHVENIEETNIAEGLLKQLCGSLKQEVKSQLFYKEIQKKKEFRLNFSDQFLYLIAQSMEEKVFGPEETIFEFQKCNDKVNLVVKGSIILYIQQPGQRGIKVVKKIGKGSICGENSFFSGERTQVGARTNNVCTIMQIHKPAFLDMIKDFPEDYQKFCHIRDQLKFNCAQQDLSSQCLVCNSYTHQFNKCHFVNYIPQQERLLFQYHKGEVKIQKKRSSFQRKFKQSGVSQNARLNLFQVKYTVFQYLVENCDPEDFGHVLAIFEENDCPSQGITNSQMRHRLSIQSNKSNPDNIQINNNNNNIFNSNNGNGNQNDINFFKRQSSIPSSYNQVNSQSIRNQFRRTSLLLAVNNIKKIRGLGEQSSCDKKPNTSSNIPYFRYGTNSNLNSNNNNNNIINSNQNTNNNNIINSNQNTNNNNSYSNIGGTRNSSISIQGVNNQNIKSDRISGFFRQSSGGNYLYPISSTQNNMSRDKSESNQSQFETSSSQCHSPSDNQQINKYMPQIPCGMEYSFEPVRQSNHSKRFLFGPRIRENTIASNYIENQQQQRLENIIQAQKYNKQIIQDQSISSEEEEQQEEPDSKNQHQENRHPSTISLTYSKLQQQQKGKRGSFIIPNKKHSIQNGPLDKRNKYFCIQGEKLKSSMQEAEPSIIPNSVAFVSNDTQYGPFSNNLNQRLSNSIVPSFASYNNMRQMYESLENSCQNQNLNILKFQGQNKHENLFDIGNLRMERKIEGVYGFDIVREFKNYFPKNNISYILQKITDKKNKMDKYRQSQSIKKFEKNQKRIDNILRKIDHQKPGTMGASNQMGFSYQKRFAEKRGFALEDNNTPISTKKSSNNIR